MVTYEDVKVILVTGLSLDECHSSFEEHLIRSEYCGFIELVTLGIICNYFRHRFTLGQ